MAAKSALAFLGEQVLIMHPLVVPFWIAGLLYYFVSVPGRPYRALAWIWVTVFLLLILSGSARSNYIGPAYVVLLAAGGVAVERARWRWLPFTLAGLFAVGGAVVAPMAVDLLPPQRYIAFEHAIGLSAPKDQIDAVGKMPLHFALKFHAPAVIAAVSKTYAALPVEDQARAGIMTASFGEAGAVNFFGPALGLPHAISAHNNYWLWGPRPYTGEVMLVLAHSDTELRAQYDEVDRTGAITCEYCLPQLSTLSVYVCRRPRRPFAETWPALKNYL